MFLETPLQSFLNSPKPLPLNLADESETSIGIVISLHLRK
jgi:hypothetical protein